MNNWIRVDHLAELLVCGEKSIEEAQRWIENGKIPIEKKKKNKKTSQKEIMDKEKREIIVEINKYGYNINETLKGGKEIINILRTMYDLCVQLEMKKNTNN